MAHIATKYHGPVADLRYRGHIAVADTAGNILWQLGDPQRMAYARSSAKPMQAVLAIESGAVDAFGITGQELAVICASHRGEDMHIQAVRSILDKAGLDESDLQCGMHLPFATGAAHRLIARGEAPSAVHNNCSGKHAGMLITAKHLGESLSDYYLPAHPLQKRITLLLAGLCGCPAGQIVTGLDGCGVPVHAMPLHQFAQGYAKFSNQRIISAMTNYPEMVGGTGDFTSELMRSFGDRLLCKSGASAYFAIGLRRQGIGIAMKMEDGSAGVIPVAVLEILVQIGVITAEEALKLQRFREIIHRNHKEETIGKTVPEFALQEN